MYLKCEQCKNAKVSIFHWLSGYACCDECSKSNYNLYLQQKENNLSSKGIHVNRADLEYNKKSILALGLGIVGILGFYLLSFIAIVVSILSIKEMSRKNAKGAALAGAGLTLGILGALVNIGQHFFK